MLNLKPIALVGGTVVCAVGFLLFIPLITEIFYQSESWQSYAVPILKPGESFEYTSGTPLKTTNGIMQGFYLMSQDNGKQLKIDIPTFSLDSPYNKKNFH